MSEWFDMVHFVNASYCSVLDTCFDVTSCPTINRFDIFMNSLIFEWYFDIKKVYGDLVSVFYIEYLMLLADKNHIFYSQDMLTFLIQALDEKFKILLSKLEKKLTASNIMLSYT